MIPEYEFTKFWADILVLSEQKFERKLERNLESSTPPRCYATFQELRISIVKNKNGYMTFKVHSPKRFKITFSVRLISTPLVVVSNGILLPLRCHEMRRVVAKTVVDFHISYYGGNTLATVQDDLTIIKLMTSR